MIVNTEIDAPCGWPVFEDGTLIRYGDEVLGYFGNGLVVNRFTYTEAGWTVSSGHGYAAHSPNGIFKRPTKDQMAEYYKKWPEEKKQAGYVKLGKTEVRARAPLETVATGVTVTSDGVLHIPDDVNHPKHYDNGRVECIDWIEAMLTPEEFRGYLKGAALKYQFRCENKGAPAKDLEKAKWYISKLKERLSQ